MGEEKKMKKEKPNSLQEEFEAIHKELERLNKNLISNIFGRMNETRRNPKRTR